jgi:hypothetical protein
MIYWVIMYNTEMSPTFADGPFDEAKSREQAARRKEMYGGLFVVKIVAEVKFDDPPCNATNGNREMR